MGNPLENQIGGDHYKTGKIQVAEYLHSNRIPFAEGSIIKYAARHKEKNGIEDLRKAMHYLQILAYLEYGVEYDIREC